MVKICGPDKISGKKNLGVMEFCWTFCAMAVQKVFPPQEILMLKKEKKTMLKGNSGGCSCLEPGTPSPWTEHTQSSLNMDVPRWTGMHLVLQTLLGEQLEFPRVICSSGRRNNLSAPVCTCGAPGKTPRGLPWGRAAPCAAQMAHKLFVHLF